MNPPASRQQGAASSTERRWRIGLLVAGILALLGLLLWRAAAPHRPAREVARPLIGVVLGFLTPALILKVCLRYSTFRVIALCLRNNALFNAAEGRTYWLWVAVVPFEFALSLGFALGLVVAVGWLVEVAGAGGPGRRGVPACFCWSLRRSSSPSRCWGSTAGRRPACGSSSLRFSSWARWTGCGATRGTRKACSCACAEHRLSRRCSLRHSSTSATRRPSWSVCSA